MSGVPAAEVAFGAAFGLNCGSLSAAATPPTAGEKDIQRRTNAAKERICGLCSHRCQLEGNAESPLRPPAGIVTLSPPGSEIVPPAGDVIG